MPQHLPKPIRRIMKALTDGLVTILGSRLVAVYVGGSAASGDFQEATSDVDFLVVTRGRLSMEDALAIKLLHQDLLREDPFAVRLEGDYAPLELLVPEGTREPVPGCEQGVFLPRVGEVMLSADNIMDLRENGVVIYGPHPREVLPPVTPDQVRAAARTHLEMEFFTGETPTEAAAALLGLLRSACALETGMPATRLDGAEWGLTRLDGDFHPAIRAALAVLRAEATALEVERVFTALPQVEQLVRSQYCSV